MPDATKEPAPRFRLPTTIRGDNNRGRARTEQLLPRVEGVSEGESDNAPVDNLNEELDVEAMQLKWERKLKIKHPYFYILQIKKIANKRKKYFKDFLCFSETE